MTLRPDDGGIALPDGVPFLLNLVLASVLGAGIAAWPGAAVGGAALIAAYMFIWLMRWLRENVATCRTVRDRGIALIRPPAALVALPFVIVLAAVAMVVSAVWEAVRPSWRLHAPSLSAATSRLRDLLRRILGEFFSPARLPTTAVNALLLLTLASVVIGIDVAFYAALAAVPLITLTLVMVAIDSSREPDGD